MKAQSSTEFNSVLVRTVSFDVWWRDIPTFVKVKNVQCVCYDFCLHWEKFGAVCISGHSLIICWHLDSVRSSAMTSWRSRLSLETWMKVKQKKFNLMQWNSLCLHSIYLFGSFRCKAPVLLGCSPHLQANLLTHLIIVFKLQFLHQGELCNHCQTIST